MVTGGDGILVPEAPSANGSQLRAESRPHADPVLVLDGVGVRFGGISALDHVSLSVDEGIVCGLIGPNGAGKTTLFDVISGVRTPNEGRVHFVGSDVTRSSAVARSRRGLRRTFQRVQTFGWLTVEDNVLAALEWRGGGGGMFADVVRLPSRRSRERARRQRVAEVLEQCGLLAVRADPVGSLPIGLARMVELARAIVDEPKLLLLDEPTSGLDEREAERLIEQMAHLRSTTSCSVILVEHDMGFVMEQCDRVVVLELGQIIATGTPKEIQENPMVRAAYLGEGTDRSNHENNDHQGGHS
jgi:ABC-type branched-subunit amino acid transport system ATPase component